MEKDAPYHIQPRIINESGREWVLEGFGMVERDADGKPIRFSGTAQDITERVRAEEALKKREKQLSESQRIAHIGSWEHNIETNEVVWSDELFRLLGLDPEKDAGDFNAFFDSIHPEDQPKLKQAIQDNIKLRKPFGIDYRYTLPDGSTRILHAQAELVPDENGKLVVLSGTGQDITERFEAEEKIRKSEEFVRSILNTVDEGLIVVDRDYLILTANRAYCAQAGGCEGEIVGMRCYEVSHKLDRPCFEAGEDCSVKHAFETGEPYSVLHKHVDKDGHVLYVETKAYPIKGGSGEVTSVIETMNNITERYLLEEERLKTQKLESIGTLAGGIAHDFNNLLLGVFGYLSLARVGRTVDDRTEMLLSQAEKALDMAKNLTNQLLTFAKGGKPIKKRLRLNNLIKDSVRFGMSGSRSASRISVDEDLRMVDADAGQIGQVIQNIIINAVESMPEGGSVTVMAQNVSREFPGSEGVEFVELSFSDTGAGIPEEYLAKIFDPYFTTKKLGSGLGLATSYSIVRNHGGTIEVDSKPGKGSTFRVYLPAAEAEAERKAEALTSAAAARTARVLVMDDEDVVLGVASEMLRAMGHEVEVARNGDEAVLKYFESMEAGAPFDVVILDLTVRGGMGGADANRKLLNMDPRARTIVTSGYSDESVMSNFSELGFSGFLKKPYRMDELRDLIASLLE